jgi:hypothetical protein
MLTTVLLIMVRAACHCMCAAFCLWLLVLWQLPVDLLRWIGATAVFISKNCFRALEPQHNFGNGVTCKSIDVCCHQVFAVSAAHVPRMLPCGTALCPAELWCACSATLLQYCQYCERVHLLQLKSNCAPLLVITLLFNGIRCYAGFIDQIDR